MPKEGSHCFFMSVILTDSVFKMNNNYIHKYFRRIQMQCQRKKD